ncbi:unnamed protein product [Urochloa decumbens]|uniref:F-box associated beta-propeller type 3 domain-containing protein n=1 Tax=Urochloa decumbens TaxID=240449 RepID=A0ABC9D269_9POAL
MEKKEGEDEILEEEQGTPAVIPSAPKKRKTRSVDGAPGADVCDDVAGNILARLPARSAVACMALSKHHRRMIRSSEFRSLHLRLAPPLPRPQIAYVATPPIRRQPERKPVSGYYAFHVAGAGAGLRRNHPMRVLAGGRYLGTRYANTCNGVVLISGEEFSTPAKCALWNPAVADDAKEVTIPDSWPDSEYLVLALGYGRSSETYKLLVCRKHRPDGSNYKYSLMIYALSGDAETPKRPPQLAVLSARLNEKINFGSLKTLYIDGTIYLLHFHEKALFAFDVDEETVSTIDLPGWQRAELFEMSGRPCVVAKDGGNRTLLRLTVDRQWERKCVIAVKGGPFHIGDLRYCPIIGVWDCGEVLVMYFKGELGVICLYDVATRKMYKADLRGDLTV